VSLPDIAYALADRATHAGITIPDSLASQLIVYFQLLSHWNRKINLTSLADQDQAVDRLLLEPVVAAGMLPGAGTLIDLGSGGGSPAVPLALALGARLVMVESRARKAAFLREVLRELGMAGAVETARFEDVAARPDYRRQFPLISIRAVRMDMQLFAVADALLAEGGSIALFRSLGAEDPPRDLPDSLHWVSSRQSLPASHSVLTLVQRST